MGEEREIIKESILVGGEAIEKAPKIKGIPTGIEGLDELFFTNEVKDGKVVRVPLGGIPSYSIFNITGVSDTGKSLMVEQYAVKRASVGEKVIFVTVESPAPFVIGGIQARSYAMGIDFEEIKDNIILIDAASYSALRDNLPTLFNTLAYAIKTYKARHTVVDSITGLFEAREMMARTVVRQVFNFLKKWYQTALFVSQKRSGHEELTAEAAGGYAVGHIVDGTMVLAKVLVDSQYKAKLYGKPVGEVVRLFRIDGCRLAGHDTRTRFFEITPEGLVKIGKALGEK